ncbi:hypothetical protein ACFWY6_16185 [Streptomyces sp. NPDC059037]
MQSAERRHSHRGGFVIVESDQVADFLARPPVEVLHGIGPVRPYAE